MSRWMIEKNGTGVEKSGTGIEKSGTGIEKSGTGIEKSGTGIEKSGTGIRKGLLAFSICALGFVSQVQATESRPEGFMQVTVDQGQVSVMWNIDGSTFVGVGSQNGTFTQVSLFEMSIDRNQSAVDVAGGGTGKKVAGGGTGKKVAGGGTGKKVAGGGTGKKVAGGGTGKKVAGGGTGKQVAGGGTGKQVAGGGTGKQVAGGGTGKQVAGGGTGKQVAGGGTGKKVAGGGTGIQVAGGGTGAEDITITLPAGTGLEMEVSLGCHSASVSVLDSTYAEVISFENVKVMGNTGLCGSVSDNGSSFRGNRSEDGPFRRGK
jgi:hypothetical protein